MLQVRTDFESGNIGAWSADGMQRLRFEAPTDGAPWAMWFYFRLEGAPDGEFEFVVTNLAQCLEATHWGDVRPVMRLPNGAWQRAAGENVRLDLAAGEFSFHFNLPGEPVEIAYSYPYPPSMVKALLNDLMSYPRVEVSYPGISAGGREIPYLIMRCINPQHKPEILWLQSREHAGEVSGAYTLDGFLRAVVISTLREFMEIHVLPMVDVDAVTEGRYGKVAPPIDHSMAWCADTPRPEIKLAMELMRSSAASGNPFRLLLNFHSPSPENDSYLAPFNPTFLTPQQRLNSERLFNALVANSATQYPFTADDMAYQRVSAWYGDDIEHRVDAFVLREFDAESLLVETSYHASSTGTPSSPAILRQAGASLAAGIEKYLLNPSPGRIGIYDSMPPVFTNTHGWILWQVPRFARLKFELDSAWAVADEPSAEVYFAAPQLYSLDEIKQIRLIRRFGGTAELIWHCYDERGIRFHACPVPENIPVSDEPQTLTLSADVPPGTAKVRPGFRLTGAFRPFEARL